MAKAARDIGASVRARLLNIARERGQVFDLILTRYALERLLFRLSISPHRTRFVLKGAMLVTTWFNDPHRPTRDLDLLGYGSTSPDGILQVFSEICGIDANDGIHFDTKTLRIDLIREELEYGGLRLRTTATIANARIAVVVDIGFGDAVEPGLEEIDLPVLLDLPAPRLRAYARETVIAEKFHAMVALGRANSRMKDFYDVWMLSKIYDFQTDRLARAITATFKRRKTALPESTETALTSVISGDNNKQRQWTAFTQNISADVPQFAEIVAEISAFIGPSLAAARQ